MRAHSIRGARVSGHFEYFGRCVDRCESPVERLFLVGLLFMGDTTLQPFDRAPTVARDGTGLELGQQVDVAGFRVDFTLSHPETSKRFAIEIDGFTFHGSTPEQFERDSSRQRVLTGKGWTVLRFSGREIRRDPRKCAAEAMVAASCLIPSATPPYRPLLASLPPDTKIGWLAAAVRGTDDWNEQCRLAQEASSIVRDRLGLSSPSKASNE